LPTHARAKVVLELLLIQITELEQSRDAVLKDETPDKAAGMIQRLAKLRRSASSAMGEGSEMPD
jgi:hypothetical protein